MTAQALPETASKIVPDDSSLKELSASTCSLGLVELSVALDLGLWGKGFPVDGDLLCEILPLRVVDKVVEVVEGLELDHGLSLKGFLCSVLVEESSLGLFLLLPGLGQVLGTPLNG